MSIAKKFEKVFKEFLPAPFTIAVLLTFLTLILAFFFTEQKTDGNHLFELLEYWDAGLWKESSLAFAVQMMLMLVLGHVLALTKPINWLIEKGTRFCNNTANAAAIITFFTLLASFLNWGLGLIFGAIFARKVGEHASKNNIQLNYPLIGAAAYSGMMVWHGGISGSAPIKLAENCHLWDLLDGTEVRTEYIPDMISLSETVFSTMNINVSILLLIILPLTMYYLGKKATNTRLPTVSSLENENVQIQGAEKIDHSKIIAYLFGGIILSFALYKGFIMPENISLNVITPNYINLVLLGLGIIMHSSFYSFLKGIEKAIRGASGILIQFPLYFGIMGIMTYSGMTQDISKFVESISNETTFPLFTFISSGIVNVLVPSGGGQWYIQGPIIMESALKLGVSWPKTIIAFAYGDQLTNMLQPFWALPLLAITGLKAKEILPYTLILLLVGAIIFISGLLIW